MLFTGCKEHNKISSPASYCRVNLRNLNFVHGCCDIDDSYSYEGFLDVYNISHRTVLLKPPKTHKNVSTSDILLTCFSESVGFRASFTNLHK